MSLPSTTEIIEDLEFFDDWEDRYKYIIDLGKSLPPMDDELKTELRLVKGCQSSVWIDPGQEGSLMTFLVDSDAIIVRGLLALVMAAYDKKTAAQIDAFDINAYFTELDLERHLSPTRGNGLKSIVARIQAMAKAAL
jgi:cysteine desulfuration protein SufE